MFRVSQHPSSGVLKSEPAASGTGHTTCTATPLQRGLIGPKPYVCGYDTTLRVSAPLVTPQDELIHWATVFKFSVVQILLRR